MKEKVGIVVAILSVILLAGLILLLIGPSSQTATVYMSHNRGSMVYTGHHLEVEMPQLASAHVYLEDRGFLSVNAQICVHYFDNNGATVLQEKMLEPGETALIITKDGCSANFRVNISGLHAYSSCAQQFEQP